MSVAGHVVALDNPKRFTMVFKIWKSEAVESVVQHGASGLMVSTKAVTRKLHAVRLNPPMQCSLSERVVGEVVSLRWLGPPGVVRRA